MNANNSETVYPTYSPTEIPSATQTNSPIVISLSDGPTIIPSEAPSIALTPQPTQTVAPTTTTIICLYGNCHGPGTVCTPGTICQYSNPYYSQCLENPSYSTGTNCHATNSWGCGGASGPTSCCNPAAICNANNVCVLPTTACLNALPIPSAQPIVAPTSQPVLSLTPVVASTSPSGSPIVPVAITDVVCLWGNCYAPSSACAVGLVCTPQQPFYSQCLEDLSYSANTTTCHATNTWGCGGASGPVGCCNPGAICTPDHVCTIPTTGCSLYTTAPSIKPTFVSAAPSVKVSAGPPVAAGRTICLYGDCTDPTTKCIPGTICQAQNPYYSQCIEDPQYTSLPASQCHTQYDWGCGGASGPSGCCNPAATCNSNSMCVLSTNCVYYAPSAPAAAQLAPPNITFVSTLALSLPAGTTFLTANEQLALCLSSEMAVNAPSGSCSVVSTSNSQDSSPPMIMIANRQQSNMMVLAYAPSHRDLTLNAPRVLALTTLYAKTKITAPATKFKVYAASQNVSLLFHSLSNSLATAVAQGTLTESIQVNSLKLNCSGTANAAVINTKVSPIIVVYSPTASPSYSPSRMSRVPSKQPITPTSPPSISSVLFPSFSPTFATSSGSGNHDTIKDSSSGVGGSLSANAQYALIGGLVGGLLTVIVAAIVALLLKRKADSNRKRTSLRRHQSSEAMLGMPGVSAEGLASNSGDSDSYGKQVVFVESRVLDDRDK